MNVAHSEEDLNKFLAQARDIAGDKTVVVSQFIEDAKEIDVDVVCIGGKLVGMAVSEHVENAGVQLGMGETKMIMAIC
jgi:carbamoylphosphate synthase large subunit